MTEVKITNSNEQPAWLRRINENKARNAADKISQLEAEIEARRDEINQLSGSNNIKMMEDTIIMNADDDEDDKSMNRAESLQQLEGLIALRDEMLVKTTSIQREDDHDKENDFLHRMDDHHDRENNFLRMRSTSAGGGGGGGGIPDIPDIVYVSSMETDDRSDEDRNPAVCHSSPRGTNINLEDVLVPSYMRSNSDSFCASPLPIKKMSLPTSSSKVRTLERMIGERDANIESLESVIESDTEIILQMKDTLKLVCEKVVATDADKFSNFYLSELESKIQLQKKKNETLESECTRLLDAILTLEEHSSSQENTIEYLKSEMVNLLLAKQMEEEKLNKELDRRRSIIISLENTFKESADQSQRLVKDLHTQSSSLEDEIAQLKADNTKLRIRAMMLEEEKAMVEEEMKTEMQLLYIETGRHDIL